MRDIAPELAAWLAARERVAIATVVRVDGSAPRPLGASLVAAAGERLAGSVSNGCVETDVYESAMASLREDRPRVVRYGISDELAFTVGLACGGEIEVLVEPVGAFHAEALREVRAERAALLVRIVAPEDRAGTVAIWKDGAPGAGWTRELDALADEARAALREGASRRTRLVLADGRAGEAFLHALPAPPVLVVVGATHVAIPLVRFAKALGYRTVVADPRAALANRERFPDADEIALAWPDDALSSRALDGTSAVVVLSHDPKFDHPALDAALRSGAGYVGAIGSRRTSDQRAAWLRENGHDPARVHSPIGLDIGARSAEETALAILAEIVAARRGRSGTALSAREPLIARA